MKLLGALKIVFPVLFYMNHLEREGCYMLHGPARLFIDSCHVKMTVHGGGTIMLKC